MSDKEHELYRADVSWFHIFKELIRSETWAKMSSNATKLYPVIKAFTNWEDGAAFPSFDTMQKYSGLARASVSKALKELEELGLLRREGAGKGSRNIAYRLVERFDVTDGEGRPAASVAFDYLPRYVSDAVTELRRFAASGLDQEGKLQIINVEHLYIQINQEGATGTQNNVTASQEQIKRLRGALEGESPVDNLE